MPSPIPGYEPTTIVGAELAQSLSWLPGDETLGWYEDAIGAVFEQAARITSDQGVDGEIDENGNFSYQTGYGTIFTVNPRFDGDTAICPTGQLPYTGQYVGVEIPPDTDDATARALITQERGQQRGKPSAIVAAAKRFLTGTQSVINLERQRPDGTASGYWFILIVRIDELSHGDTWEQLGVPWEIEAGAWSGTDQTVALTNAVNLVKPAGVNWTLVETNGHVWSTATKTWSAETTTWQQSDTQTV